MRRDGTVWCWGFAGNPAARFYPEATKIAGVSDARAVAAGYGFGCALIGDGTVRCFGENSHSQLGTGATKLSLAGVPVAGVSGAVAVAASDAYACVVRGSGEVWCWGNSDGVFREGVDVTTPARVVAPSSATSVDVGAGRGCQISEDQTVACWGRNLDGALGQSTYALPASDAAIPIPDLMGVTAASVGGDFWCGLLGDGTVRCAGTDLLNQLGDGAPASTAMVPVAVDGVTGAVGVEAPCVTDAVQVAAGEVETCALRSDGTVTCWGSTALVAGGIARDPDHPECLTVPGP